MNWFPGAPADLGIIHTCGDLASGSEVAQIYPSFSCARIPARRLPSSGVMPRRRRQPLLPWAAWTWCWEMTPARRCPSFFPVGNGRACGAVRQAGPAAFTVPFLTQGPPIRRRVNLKIQDGCDAMCSHCYIPFSPAVPVPAYSKMSLRKRNPWQTGGRGSGAYRCQYR